MKRSLLLVVVCLACPVAVRGQYVGASTKEGQAALEKLLQACIDGGALEVEKTPQGKKTYMVKDKDKVAEVVKANAELLTPKLVDQVVFGVLKGVEPRPAVAAALLRAQGSAKEDRRALAFAAFFAGLSLNPREAKARTAAYEDAADSFAALDLADWRALSLNNLAELYHTVGDEAKSLECGRKALEIFQKLHDGPYPLTATSLLNVGVAYGAVGDTAKALEYGLMALAMFEKLKYDSVIPTCLNNVGEAYHDLGDGAKALEYCQRALAMYQKLYDGPHPLTAGSLNSVGKAYRALGNATKALEYFQKSLTMCEKLYDGPHSLTATSLSSVGVAYVDLGDGAKALEYGLKALTMNEKLYDGPHPMTAACLSNVAMFYLELGESGKALEYGLKALAMNEKLHDGPHSVTATSLNNVGKAYGDRGDAAKALEYGLKALAMNEKLHDGPHPLTATSLSNVGETFGALGDAAKALEYCQRALTMSEKLHDGPHPMTAASLNKVGTAYSDLGDAAKALQYHQKTLAMNEKLHDGPHPTTATSLNNIGKAYIDLGDAAKSLQYYQKALAMDEKLRTGPHPSTATTLNNIGGAYSVLGDMAKALEYGQKALAMRQKLYDGPHPDTAGNFLNLATYQYNGGNGPEARAYVDQARRQLALPGIKNPSQPGDFRPLPLAIGIFALSLRLDLAAGADPAATEGKCKLALDLLDRLRVESLASDESKLAAGADYFDLFPLRALLAGQRFAAGGEAAGLADAVITAERGRARVFLESLGRSRATALAGAPAKVRDREAELLVKLAACDARIQKEDAKPKPAGLIQLHQERTDAEVELKKFIAQLTRDYPAYAGLKYPQPCTLEEARDCLGVNEVALLFLPGSESSCLVVLDKLPAKGQKAAGIAVYPLPKSDDLAQKVRALTNRKTLELPARCKALGADLYSLLFGIDDKSFGPLAKRIKGKDLVIVAGESLSGLPFEMLYEKDGPDDEGHFLIEKHRIRYAPSLTALHLLKQWNDHRDQRPTRPLFAIGDPVYQADDKRLGNGTVAKRDGDGDDFQRLVASGPEVTKIRELFKADKDAVLTDLLASEAAVKTASEKGTLAKARYVHFATHGILGLDRGRQPALVLNLVGNDGQEQGGGVNDGFLQMDEVTNLQLNADLVVLSACETGKGRLHHGEGVTGLARAFLYAGSKGVVCSLWSVDDAATADFMVDVYTQLQDNTAAVDALRAAKLRMIRDGKAPYYWAPFILIGDMPIK